MLTSKFRVASCSLRGDEVLARPSAYYSEFPRRKWGLLTGGLTFDLVATYSRKVSEERRRHLSVPFENRRA